MATKTGKFDYDTPIAGLEVIDRYTLRIRLKVPDYNFAYMLAMPSTGAAAREVVETYGQDIGSHPVGTGAYQLSCPYASTTSRAAAPVLGMASM